MKHELTFTLKPFMYNKTAREQFDITNELVLNILKPYRHTTVAELTSLNNIHYHSLIDIEGIIQKDILLNRIRPVKMLGKPHLTAVQYETSYEEYLKKDIIKTTTIINRYPVLKDDWCIFGPSSSSKFIRVGGDGVHRIISKNIYKEPVPADTATGGSKIGKVNWEALNFGIDFTEQRI